LKRGYGSMSMNLKRGESGWKCKKPPQRASSFWKPKAQRVLPWDEEKIDLTELEIFVSPIYNTSLNMS
jgi:hypothetical protein